MSHLSPRIRTVYLFSTHNGSCRSHCLRIRHLSMGCFRSPNTSVIGLIEALDMSLNNYVYWSISHCLLFILMPKSFKSIQVLHWQRACMLSIKKKIINEQLSVVSTLWQKMGKGEWGGGRAERGRKRCKYFHGNARSSCELLHYFLYSLLQMEGKSKAFHRWGASWGKRTGM